MKSLTTLTLLCVALAGCRSSAQHEAPPTHDGTTVTRAYDISDLIIEIPNFDPATRATATTQPTRSHEDAVRELITTITSSVDPLSWYENTGTLGSVHESEGQLLITQSPRNHELIQQKFQQMRDKRAVQVTVEMRVITGAAIEKHLTSTADGWISLSNSTAELYPRFLPEAELKAMMLIMQRDMFSTIVTAPRITIFNGQRAYVLMSRQTAYVADLHQAGDKLEPDIKIAESGMLMDCQAKVSEDQKLVTITLRPRLSTLLGMDTKPWPGGKDHVIQVPDMLIREATATITMPDQMTAVYRVHSRREAATQPADESPVYVLVKPKVIVNAEAAAHARQPSLSRRD